MTLRRRTRRRSRTSPGSPGHRPCRSARAPARRRGGRLRWAAAIAIVAVILGASAAVAALITNGASRSTVLGYVPPGSIAYGEVRLDLPGDQRQAVGAFLSKFPGFHDQAALDTKLDEILDQFIKKATNDKQTYTADIKPWFGGEIGLTVGPLPPASSMTDPATVTNALRALALLSVTDPAAADAWIDKTIAASGAKTTTETYNGVSLTVLDAGTGPKIAYAVIGDKVAAFGDLTSVKAAVDTGGKSGFESEPGPKAALASSSGDHVGFVYLALQPLLAWSTDLNKAAASQSGATVAALDDSIKSLLPAWTAGWLSFDNDAMVIESTAPKAQTPIGPTENRTSTLARHIPSTAIATSISNDLGKTIDQALTLYGSQPAYKDMLDQVDKALGLIGGREGAIGWIGDTALVVNDAGGTLEGGIVIDPTDSAAAARLSAALQALVGLGGASQGITVHDESYNGTTITIVDLGDASKLSGAGGTSMALPLPAGHIEIAYAVTDDVVVDRHRAGLRQACPRHDRGDLARRPIRSTSGSPTGSGPGPRRHSSTSPPCAGWPRRRWPAAVSPAASTRPTSSRSSSRSTPCTRRTRRRPTSTSPRSSSRSSKRGVPRRPTAQNEEDQHAHGSPHQADARRRDQAADLSRRRRRRPQRPRRARDRDHRPLQPAHRTGRVRRRRRQGEVVAGQGCPAVRHGPAPVSQRGHRARSQVEVPTMAAKDLVEYVAKSLVDDPDAVTVEVVEEDGATVIELHVAEDDMGKVIGRNGSVAKALRTLLKVTAARDGEPVQLEIL